MTIFLILSYINYVRSICRYDLGLEGVEEVYQFGSEGGFDRDLFVGAGVGELQLGGVEEVAFELQAAVAGQLTDDVRGSVEEVAYDGVAEGLKMHADLVGAAGFDLDFDEGEEAERSGEAFEYVDVRHRRSTVSPAGGHADAADQVARDGEVDRRVVLGEVAVGECDVGLVHLAGGEHLAQLAVGYVVLGDDDGAGGLLVEAVHDARAQGAAYVGELGEMKQEGIDEGA